MDEERVVLAVPQRPDLVLELLAAALPPQLGDPGERPVGHGEGQQGAQRLRVDAGLLGRRRDVAQVELARAGEDLDDGEAERGVADGLEAGRGGLRGANGWARGHAAELRTGAGGRPERGGVASSAAAGPCYDGRLLAPTNRRRAWAKLAAVLVVVAVLLVAQRLGVFRQLADPAGLKQAVVGLGAWGYVAYVVAYAALQPFGFPATVFTLGAPLIWPWYVAFALAMTGTMAASVVGFLFARFVARDWVAARIPERYRRHDEALGRRAFATVLLLRSMFWMSSPLHAFFGVSRVRFGTHLWGSLIAYVPPLLLLSVFGERLFELARGAPPGLWIALAAGVVALGLLVWGIRRRRMRLSAGTGPTAPP